ncbi:Piso0_004972 [Millerozyma farinosa CBS 7064]|uniref:Piso0_004972 protein n=1 Tax=Pichia sorbitophila (strain ATCC MYA-4447 / BCRC 22081 / CBS 7064 / NBRC 10061 / NRRL Y-12695) TaxID=559304 RepID=G8Y3W3_PICSO|nr:Piso0_004972 [Millerozyma farinosa CBS 7064]
MVAKSHSGTPNAENEDHPAHGLSYGSTEKVQTLMKLHPTYMPNTVLSNEKELNEVRSSYNYVYVMTWLSNYRGFVRLQSELFDVDLFEIELLNIVNPPPVDESVLFINKLKLALISALQNAKCSLINNFENIFRLWFGYDTPLQGKELTEEEEEEEQEKQEIESSPKFDFLSFKDKIEILYLLTSYISSYHTFRSYVDRSNFSPDLMRFTPIFSEKGSQNGTTVEYVLAFEGTRLYKQVIEYTELSIPKKRKEAPTDPEEEIEPEQFDVKSVKFELICKNIYELDEFLIKIYPNRKVKKNKILYSELANDEVIEGILNTEIRKRKFISSRRKELQLANLLATRKRSSRLEAKEKQKQEEFKLMRAKEAEELKMAAQRRSERRHLLRRTEPTAPTSYTSSNLTREERLKLRKLNNEVSASPDISRNPSKDVTPKLEDTQAPQQNLGDAEKSDVPNLNPSTDTDARNLPDHGSTSTNIISSQSQEAEVPIQNEVQYLEHPAISSAKPENVSSISEEVLQPLSNHIATNDDTLKSSQANEDANREAHHEANHEANQVDSSSSFTKNEF